MSGIWCHILRRRRYDDAGRPPVARILARWIGFTAAAVTTVGVATAGSAAADPPLKDTLLSPVVADQLAVPGLAAGLVSSTAYAGGATPATLNVTNTAAGAVTLNVALVRTSDSTVVHRWSTQPVAPGATEPIVWNPAADVDAATDAAAFQFQVWATSPAGSAITSVLSPVPQLADTVQVRPFAHPVDGRHDYGIAGEGRFGTGRSGHMHQGQDVFARCGTPVVATHAGTVQFEEFQASAGNYVVIDEDGTHEDTVYMHLRDRARPEEGVHVDTGETIGAVGDTGDASECHLHFERWRAPGWYEGGQPIDPLAALKRWE